MSELELESDTLYRNAYDKTSALLSSWESNHIHEATLLSPSLTSLSRVFFESPPNDSVVTQPLAASAAASAASASHHLPSPPSASASDGIDNTKGLFAHSNANSSRSSSSSSSSTNLGSPNFFRHRMHSRVSLQNLPNSNPQRRQRREQEPISYSTSLQESVHRMEMTLLHSNKYSTSASSFSSSSNSNMGDAPAKNTAAASINNPISNNESFLINSLTSILLNNHPNTATTATTATTANNTNINITSSESMTSILNLFSTTPRRVCQHPFRKNDIVWVCRTCQSDETCVLCHDCYSRSDHEGHDVAFYHAQAGGCCDCGDPDAWDPKGFCDLHGDNYKKNYTSQDPNSNSSTNPNTIKHVEDKAKGMVEAIGDWLVKEVVTNVEKGWNRTEHHTTLDNSSTLELGMDGLSQQGLFLLLHSDDIHSPIDCTSALSQLYHQLNSTSTILNKICRLLKNPHGYLILWGTNELTAELGTVVSSLWKDGDKSATNRVASLIQEKATFFKKTGLHVTIQTHLELRMQQRAIAVLHWLSVVARSCDSLCEVVAHSLSQRHLIPLLEADLKLPRKITSAWHALLLTLLAIPQFKQNLAAAYCDSYGKVTKEYAQGVGVLDCSCFTLSVQFLNREKYVKELVKGRCLLERLIRALLETLRLASFSIVAAHTTTENNYHHKKTTHANNNDGTAMMEDSSSSYPMSPSSLLVYHSDTNESSSSSTRSTDQHFETITTINPLHPVLSHRRYSPCISDLKCVLNVVGMAKEFAAGGKCLHAWLELLSIPMGMDGQKWRTRPQGHVDREPKGWIGAFNASISLGSLFERVLIWEDTDISPLYKSGENTLLTAAEVTHETLLFIGNWQTKYFSIYLPTCNSALPSHAQCSAILPYTTISIKHSTPSHFSTLPLSQTHSWSFHYPLHRFAASCLRECARREEHGMDKLEHLLFSSPVNTDVHLLLEGLMEISLLVLSRVTQIRAGLWKRNGQGMHDQVLNYAEPPFCRALRDADLTVLQFAIVALMKMQVREGIAHFTNLSIHRYGVFEFCGFAKQSEDDFLMNKVGDEILNEPGENEILNEDESDYDDTDYDDTDYDDNDDDDNDDDDNDDDGTLEKDTNRNNTVYSPAQGNVVASLQLLEELLHLWILLLTELPFPSSSLSPEKSIKQAKDRLRREVIHRLASGPKTHSELAEVHHVLPARDNIVLNNEGKILNPDDATGAALESVLSSVATQQNSRNFGPNKWELNKDVWVDYDPAFWHIAQRSHQTIAEIKPTDNCKTGNAYPYAPKPPDAHEWFKRLRRDLLCDAVVLSVCYRVLHVHCCGRTVKKDEKNTELRGAMAYGKEAMSETTLSRTIHLLTLAANAWKEKLNTDECKIENRNGNVFIDGKEMTCENWVKKALLADPEHMLDSSWYKGEDCALLLLQRLATEGGGRDENFTVQDSSLRAGAKWLCDFAVDNNSEAEYILNKSKQQKDSGTKKEGRNLEKLKKEAQMRAIQKMNNLTRQFLDVIQDEESEDDNAMSDKKQKDEENSSIDPNGKNGIHNQKSDKMLSLNNLDDLKETNNIAHSKRFLSLMKERPQCIICVDGEGYHTDDGNEQSTSSKIHNNNALAFCAHAQASTVLKGGGGPPNGDSVSRFVGTHVTLCGHAVHISCCDSYLSSVASREASTAAGDRLEGGKKGEFRCPLCQRLSNCLVPFIDVGIDWVENPRSQNEIDDKHEMDIDPPASTKVTTLHSFLSTTTWIQITLPQTGSLSSSHNHQSSHNSTRLNSSSNNSLPHKRRSITKKDICAAWSTVMRTPRFRRKANANSSLINSDTAGSTTRSMSKENGVAEVWRRLMDQLSDVSHRADWKRLGEDNLGSNYGEFRHYHVEKVAYNESRREAEKMDWPLCLYSGSITENQRDEISREKLISKLLLSIQSFTYSICAEAADIRYRSSKKSNFYTIFGIQSLSKSGALILMPDVDGDETFDGRLGKLRHLGLAIMAACSALAKEIVSLVLPLENPTTIINNERDSRHPVRAPIVYPLLYGHILTHVVAAMCATCGKGRVKSNAMGSELFGNKEDYFDDDLESNGFDRIHETSRLSLSSIRDCENFIKIGMIARALQSMLGHLNFGYSMEADRNMLGIIEPAVMDYDQNGSKGGWDDAQWRIGCFDLLKAAVSPMSENLTQPQTISLSTQDILDKFAAACSHAREVSTSFLSDCALILQILMPGTVKEDRILLKEEVPPIQELAAWLRIEPLSEMMDCSLVKSMVSKWYQEAMPLDFTSMGTKFDERTELVKRLDVRREFRVFDWPLIANIDFKPMDNQILTLKNGNSQMTGTTRVSILNFPVVPPSKGFSAPISTSQLLSSKKRVALIGGYQIQRADLNRSDRPRIKELPTSYTDLYAELGVLCPDNERTTALCLVCGETLNANGRSECTKHTLRCGGGSGIFFLVHECIGLIMHGHKAAYVHSPYVDSHGETPQYRGRPLNLDLNRYEILREMWVGHLVRQRVITERGSSRQVIIPNFY